MDKYLFGTFMSSKNENIIYYVCSTVVNLHIQQGKRHDTLGASTHYITSFSMSILIACSSKSQKSKTNGTLMADVFESRADHVADAFEKHRARLIRHGVKFVFDSSTLGVGSGCASSRYGTEDRETTWADIERGCSSFIRPTCPRRIAFQNRGVWGTRERRQKDIDLKLR